MPARAPAAIDRRPAVVAPLDLVEAQLTADENSVARVLVRVIEVEPAPLRIADGGAVARALERVVSGEDRVVRVLLPRPGELKRTRDADGVRAVFAAARVAGVEHVEPAVMADDVRRLHQVRFPRLVVAEELDRLAAQCGSAGFERLRPDRRGVADAVAVL